MSLVHIRFRKIASATPPTYIVESPDFATDRVWMTVGEVILDQAGGRFTFFPAPLWVSNSGFPPEFKATSSEGSPWSRVIDGYSSLLLKKSDLPNMYPQLFADKEHSDYGSDHANPLNTRKID